MTNQEQMPHNAETERRIVGACMIESNFLHRLKQSGVTADDFYTPLPRELFRLMFETGKTELTALGAMRPEPEWIPDIAEVFASIVTTAPFSDWLKELLECAERRRVIRGERCYHGLYVAGKCISGDSGGNE